MSAYTDFVRQHLKSAKGATQKDKFRAVAAMWRARKGKGLHAPGVAGRGTRKGKGSMWSDYDMAPRTNGEGFGDLFTKGLRAYMDPVHEAKKAIFGFGTRRRVKRSGVEGGALSGMLSAKQKAALGNLIRHGGKVGKKGASKGVLADLLKGLDISIN